MSWSVSEGFLGARSREVGTDALRRRAPSCPFLLLPKADDHLAQRFHAFAEIGPSAVVLEAYDPRVSPVSGVRTRQARSRSIALRPVSSALYGGRRCRRRAASRLQGSHRSDP